MNWRTYSICAGLSNGSGARDANGWEAVYVQTRPQGGCHANFSPMVRSNIPNIVANTFKSFGPIR